MRARAWAVRVRRVLGSLRAAPRAPRRPKGWLSPEEDALVPPRDLWIGPGDSIHHYYRWAWEYFAYLVLLCDLQRDSMVLELGCGHGRTARGLLEYTRAPGGYRGLDVDEARIEDARGRIEARYPNFQFVHSDVQSAQYNPTGAVRAADYVFPFADEAFDVVYAASLFTHLLPVETSRYFHETRRVLRAGGKCLFSVFLLDHYRGPGTTNSRAYEPEYPLAGADGVAVRDPARPDDLVAYSRSTLEALAAAAGLRVEKVWPGLWSESPGPALNEQDLLVLVRA